MKVPVPETFWMPDRYVLFSMPKQYYSAHYDYLEFQTERLRMAIGNVTIPMGEFLIMVLRVNL